MLCVCLHGKDVMNQSGFHGSCHTRVQRCRSWFDDCNHSDHLHHVSSNSLENTLMAVMSEMQKKLEFFYFFWYNC